MRGNLLKRGKHSGTEGSKSGTELVSLGAPHVQAGDGEQFFKKQIVIQCADAQTKLSI